MVKLVVVRNLYSPVLLPQLFAQLVYKLTRNLLPNMQTTPCLDIVNHFLLTWQKLHEASTPKGVVFSTPYPIKWTCYATSTQDSYRQSPMAMLSALNSIFRIMFMGYEAQPSKMREVRVPLA